MPAFSPIDQTQELSWNVQGERHIAQRLLDSVIDGLSFEMAHYIAIFPDYSLPDYYLPASLAYYGNRDRRLHSAHLSPPHM
jgi:hypothetical protein